MNNNFDLVSFGETMVRLSAQKQNRLEQTEVMDVFVGGSESNVAIATKRLGLDTAFVTKLTDNPLGRKIENKIREHGVDTKIKWTEEYRNGKYFLEYGANPRPSSVIYDRADTAISNIRKDEIKWSEHFKNSRLFHTSGITPALSKSTQKVTKEALKLAKSEELLTSIDLNYRSKLWTQEEAKKCMTDLMDYTDLLITTEEDTERVFGITGNDYKEVASKLSKQFDLKVVAITLRDNISMWRNDWTSIAYSNGEIYEDMTYELELVDRVGGGDSFTAGFLFGYLTGEGENPVQRAVEFGNATSAVKQTNPGDINWGTLQEVQSLVKGDGRIRIDR